MLKNFRQRAHVTKKDHSKPARVPIKPLKTPPQVKPIGANAPRTPNPMVRRVEWAGYCLPSKAAPFGATSAPPMPQSPRQISKGMKDLQKPDAMLRMAMRA